ATANPADVREAELLLVTVKTRDTLAALESARHIKVDTAASLQNGLVKDVVVSEGTLSASLVHPREVFKPAILESAASLILLHNHPSGDPTPSREDIRLTRQLVECGRLLDLRIHDHIVIGRGRFASLAERGAL
ncbi:MAG: hypothetical protein HY953_06985, partial [Candidatus Rokubacteria bacterium]|nr:hypothetical protein [Candidatus Rokubacteria bacterium]